MSYSKQIEKRINDAAYGSVFIISDFTDLSNYDTARKNLSRFEKDNKIKKICRGVYYKPKYSNLLNETVAPSINSIAEAIARNNNWSITPSGENALNQLGISFQVPGRYLFISSGPYRKYIIENNKIEFIHRNDKDINGKSYITRLIIQAIKAIGKNRINEYISKFRLKLSKEEKTLVLKESRRTTAWIYAVIKEITREELN